MINTQCHYGNTAFDWWDQQDTRSIYLYVYPIGVFRRTQEQFTYTIVASIVVRGNPRADATKPSLTRVKLLKHEFKGYFQGF